MTVLYFVNNDFKCFLLFRVKRWILWMAPGHPYR